MTVGKSVIFIETNPPGESEPEASLLARLTRGDPDAFWALWQKHARRLFAVCLREMSGNHADAEDALGQTMLKAFEQLPRFAGEVRCAEAWLIRLTRNLCRDIDRQHSRGDQAAKEFQRLAVSFCTESSDTVDTDPESLIRALPPRLREVVVLRLIQRMAYKDIAVRLQLTADAARKRVQQARETMQHWIRDEGPHCTAPITPHRRSHSQTEARPFDCRPTRAHQKIATLRAYVKEHPTGWKKYLTLGDLLNVIGNLAEAAECYRHVVEKRPWLTDVSEKLETVLQTLESR
jgi:RNA polymerase sigma factor (sigma-70 family)